MPLLDYFSDYAMPLPITPFRQYVATWRFAAAAYFDALYFHYFSLFSDLDVIFMPLLILLHYICFFAVTLSPMFIY